MKVEKFLAFVGMVASPAIVALWTVAAPGIALILQGLEDLRGGFDVLAGIALILTAVLMLLRDNGMAIDSQLISLVLQ